MEAEAAKRLKVRRDYHSLESRQNSPPRPRTSDLLCCLILASVNAVFRKLFAVIPFPSSILQQFLKLIFHSTWIFWSTAAIPSSTIKMFLIPEDLPASSASEWKREAKCVAFFHSTLHPLNSNVCFIHQPVFWGMRKKIAFESFTSQRFRMPLPTLSCNSFFALYDNALVDIFELALKTNLVCCLHRIELACLPWILFTFYFRGIRKTDLFRKSKHNLGKQTGWFVQKSCWKLKVG